MDEGGIRGALAAAKRAPFWLDQPGALPPEPALRGADQAELAVIGRGFTGLGAALQAKPERGPP